MKELLIDVTQDFEGERIDKYLSRLVTDSSRSAIQKLIESGSLKYNDAHRKIALKLFKKIMFSPSKVICPTK